MLHRKPEDGAALQFSCVAGDVVRRMDLPCLGWPPVRQGQHCKTVSKTL